MNEAALIVSEAEPKDASAIATIHLGARRRAMPYLNAAHTDEEMREYFIRVVADRPQTWWIVRQDYKVAAYMCLDGEDLDHLYVSPAWQRHGLGSALIDKAKALSPGRLQLRTFQRNLGAQAFYEAKGFRCIAKTDGENEEGEPDILYEWRSLA